MFYKKSEIDSKLLALENRLSSISNVDFSELSINYIAYSNTIELKHKNNVLSTITIPQYTLKVTNNQSLDLLKDGQTVSSVNFDFSTFKGDTIIIKYRLTNDTATPSNPSDDPGSWSDGVPSRNTG